MRPFEAPALRQHSRWRRQMAREHRRHHRGQEGQRCQRCPGPLPGMQVRPRRDGRHQQRRGDDAHTGAAVVKAEHQPGGRCAARCGVPQGGWRARADQAGREQAARDEGSGTGHPGKTAQREQKSLVQHRAVAGEQQCRAAHAGQQHGARVMPCQPAWSEQGTDQVTGGIDRVHRPGREIAPAQIAAHRWQQQGVGKARQAQRDGCRQCQSRCHDQGRWPGRSRFHGPARLSSRCCTSSANPAPRSCWVR